MTSLDLRQFETNKYRTYRVLRAPGAWSQMYRERIQKFGNHRNVIIFPETILGLRSKVFSVRRPGFPSDRSSTDETGFGVASHKPIVLYDGNEISSIDELLDLEANNSDPARLKLVSNREVRFNDPQIVLFRSADAAALYLEKTVRAEIRRYFG